MSLRLRRSSSTGLPLLGVVSLFVWSSPAWSLYPTLHGAHMVANRVADDGLVADLSGTGSRGAGQGPPAGTGPGSGMGLSSSTKQEEAGQMPQKSREEKEKERGKKGKSFDR